MIGHIRGFSRKFWQGNSTHRGTPEKVMFCSCKKSMFSLHDFVFADAILFTILPYNSKGEEEEEFVRADCTYFIFFMK